MFPRLTQQRVISKLLGQTCEMCGTVNQDRSRGQWWNLTGYRKLFWGLFCPACFEVVSLDGEGNPRHPEATAMALQRMKYRGIYKLFQQRAEEEEKRYKFRVLDKLLKHKRVRI